MRANYFLRSVTLSKLFGNLWEFICNFITYFYRREDSLDVEVAASGYVKEFHDIYGVEEEEEAENDQVDETPNIDSAIEEEVARLVQDFKFDLESASQVPEISETSLCPNGQLVETEKPVQQLDSLSRTDQEKISQDQSETEIIPDAPEADAVQELDDWSFHRLQSMKSRQRSKVAGSVASMSTIHPDVIKKQVKKTFERRQNAEALTRIHAKGEASAATRKRRENKDMVRADGFWGWDN